MPSQSVAIRRMRDSALQHHQSGRWSEASRLCLEILTIDERHADSLHLLGVIALQTGKYPIAAQLIGQAISINPKDPAYYLNFGALLQKLGRVEQAVQCYQEALALKPQYLEVHNSLGHALQSLGRLDEADDQYERALALDPNFADARVNRALLQLLTGDFRSGWRNYEWRWRLLKPRSCAQPLWRGELLDGARILLYAEQGLGDCLQFLRYLPMVQAAGGTVVLEVPPSLHRIAAQLPGITLLTDAEDASGLLDWHCPLMSLPLVFDTALENIPTPLLLSIPEEARRVAAGRSWPDKGVKGVRVGLVWAGSPTHQKDRYRSMPLSQLEPLFRVAGVHLYSLQMGEAGAQLAKMSAEIVDLTPAIDDMADTAALIAHLDLVLCVDTSVAHLAASLGKPVWLMLPFAPDWRWLLNRNDSPWYPTMRLFRQATLGDWSSVVHEVRTALQQFVREQSGLRGI
jgi:tetratricopeptide (TPR) repeat protein